MIHSKTICKYRGFEIIARKGYGSTSWITTEYIVIKGSAIALNSTRAAKNVIDTFINRCGSDAAHNITAPATVNRTHNGKRITGTRI